MLQRIFQQIGLLLAYDLAFVVLLFLLVLPLKYYRRAAYAVMWRNFIAYFSNPTGYVFLCFFVLLTSLAAFWPKLDPHTLTMAAQTLLESIIQLAAGPAFTLTGGPSSLQPGSGNAAAAPSWVQG